MLREFLLISTLHFLAVASPGPDLALVMRNSLMGSKKAGTWTAIGIGTGILVHVVLVLLGLGIVITRSEILYSLIRLAGAFFLLYIGLKTLTHLISSRRKSAQNDSEQEKVVEIKSEISARHAFMSGLFTNLLNPKVILFFLGLFSSIITQNHPFYFQIICGLEVVLATTLYFIVIVNILSFERIQSLFRKIQNSVEAVFGIAMLTIGIYIIVNMGWTIQDFLFK
jgi:RhtB (resistance to homoserine/threonine) family protein